MDLAIDVFFYGGAALYLAAVLMVVRYMRGIEDRPLAVASRLLMGGAFCLVCVFALRWAHWRLVPLTNMTDSLNLFILLSTVAVLVVMTLDKNPALLCFAIPPLASASLINVAAAERLLHEAPRDLRSVPLMIHVGLAFLAYSLFFLASVTSAAYLFQAQRLKRHETVGLFQRLPSLEQLDRSLVRLVGYGYPLFVVTLLLGLAWARVDHDLLDSLWWLSPKVLLSFVMAVFYAGTYQMRRAGRLRGEKLAYHMFLGFVVLLATYVVLEFANLRAYHFWGNGL